MTTWVIPCNIKFYDLDGAFSDLKVIDWRQSTNVCVDDTVYIYVGQSVGQIRYKCSVLKIDKNTSTIDDSKYTKSLPTAKRFMELEFVKEYPLSDSLKLKSLKENGLKTPQGPSKATDELISYLDQF